MEFKKKYSFLSQRSHLHAKWKISKLQAKCDAKQNIQIKSRSHFLSKFLKFEEHISN